MPGRTCPTTRASAGSFPVEARAEGASAAALVEPAAARRATRSAAARRSSAVASVIADAAIVATFPRSAMTFPESSGWFRSAQEDHEGLRQGVDPDRGPRPAGVAERAEGETGRPGSRRTRSPRPTRGRGGHRRRTSGGASWRRRRLGRGRARPPSALPWRSGRGRPPWRRVPRARRRRRRRRAAGRGRRRGEKAPPIFSVGAILETGSVPLPFGRNSVSLIPRGSKTREAANSLRGREETFRTISPRTSYPASE